MFNLLFLLVVNAIVIGLNIGVLFGIDRNVKKMPDTLEWSTCRAIESCKLGIMVPVNYGMVGINLMFLFMGGF